MNDFKTYKNHIIKEYHKVMNTNTYILNIGLNVGTVEPPKQENRTFEQINDLLDLCAEYTGISSKVVQSEYNGTAERSFVVTIQTHSEMELTERLKAMAERLQQECIGMYCKERENGILVYSDSFKGQKYSFDVKYFKF